MHSAKEFPSDFYASGLSHQGNLLREFPICSIIANPNFGRWRGPAAEGSFSVFQKRPKDFRGERSIQFSELDHRPVFSQQEASAMPNIKLSHTAAAFVPDTHLPPGACPGCDAQSVGDIPFRAISEHALAAVQQSPRMAAAQHRQFLQVSPAEIVATGITGATPDSVTLHLEGTIGAVPYDFDLTFALDLPNEQLVVTLDVSQPVAYQGSWTFKLHPLSLAGASAASTLPVRYASASLVNASLHDFGGVIGCVVKCLGPQVIAVVLECLPALISGKGAFLACLVQQAQASLPNVVQCIQQCK